MSSKPRACAHGAGLRVLRFRGLGSRGLGSNPLKEGCIGDYIEKCGRGIDGY